jgi:hypothetical protein
VRAQHGPVGAQARCRLLAPFEFAGQGGGGFERWRADRVGNQVQEFPLVADILVKRRGLDAELARAQRADRGHDRDNLRRPALQRLRTGTVRGGRGRGRRGAGNRCQLTCAAGTVMSPPLEHAIISARHADGTAALGTWSHDA